jgi:hypothetical protein
MRERAPLALVALALSGCGYHLAHAPVDPLGPFTVVPGAVLVADSVAIAALEDGARAELARAGELGSGGTIEVELLRVDEDAEGLAAVAGAPSARAVRVSARGRARLRRAGSAAVERDTGDVRVSEVGARVDGPVRGMAAAGALSRSAARRLGEVLVRRLLGYPEPGEP